MPSHRVLMSLLALLFIASSGLSQEKKLKTNKDGQLEVTPEMAEKWKRQSERLRDPSFIKLEIVPVSNCSDEEAKKTSDCYKAHSKIEIKLLMTNMSSETINTTININNPYYSNNLQLFRDGELLTYRKDVTEMITKPPPFVSSIRVKLEPGKTKMATMISLNQWYGPLEAGHYQLDIKRRFLPDGGWTATASTTFEVEPK